jgi:hypothetical protein
MTNSRTRRAVIVDVVRSPFARGRSGGLLDGLHPVDLYAQVLDALVRRTGVDPARVEDVITGCVMRLWRTARVWPAGLRKPSQERTLTGAAVVPPVPWRRACGRPFLPKSTRRHQGSGRAGAAPAFPRARRGK